MSGLYEELQRKFGGEGQGGAFSTMALMSLPPNVRNVMQLMLRNKGVMTYPALCEAVDAMPEHKRPARAELDEILDALCRLGWFTQEEKDQTVTYKASLGRTVSSPAQRSRHASDAQTQKEEPDAGATGDSLTKGKPRRKAGRAFIRGLWDAVDSDDEE